MIFFVCVMLQYALILLLIFCFKQFIFSVYLQLLMSSKMLMSGRQDIACSAVMGAAVAIGGHIFLPQSDTNITCCPHCSGEIKQI